MSLKDFSFSDLSSLLENRCDELITTLKEPNENNDLIKGMSKELKSEIGVKRERVVQVLNCIDEKLNKYTGI